MMDTNTVLVEADKSEVDMATQNIMGSQAITKEQLHQLHESLRKAHTENDALKRDQTLKENVLIGQQNKLRGVIEELEKKLFETEFLV